MTQSITAAWRHLCLFVLMSFGASLHAAAATPLNVPTLDIQIHGVLGSPTFSARGGPRPYAFDVDVDLFAGLALTADLYFGVLLPGGQAAVSWVNDAGNLTLQDGMTPIVTGLEMNQTTSFSLARDQLEQEAIEHIFTGDEPLGMYVVFALLVAEGQDPGNTQNWLAVDMQPLMVEPEMGSVAE
jgi:hypothetical protein